MKDLMLFFFFSSRRRHTRWTGDWSSDVCSSDLLHDFGESTSPHSSGIMKADHMAKAIEKQELTEVSEAQIAVHWKEEEYYQIGRRRVGKECRSRWQEYQ